MADRPTPIDGADRDPELERRLTALNRLQDEVTSPPPVQELTARVRQRRTRRFAVASTAAAAAAVIAGMLVLASRPDGDHDVTAGEPATTEAPATSAPSTATTLDESTGSTACGQPLPADTFANHDVVLSDPRSESPGMLTMRLTNRGTEKLSVETTQAVVVGAVDGRIATQRLTLIDAEPVHRTLPAGTSILVDFHMADGTCGPSAGTTALLATPIIELTTGHITGSGTLDSHLVSGPEIDFPIEVGRPTTTAAPATTTTPNAPLTVPPSSVPAARTLESPTTTTTIPAACAPTPTVPPQPVNRSTTTARSFPGTPCAPPPTAPPSTTTIPR